MPLRDIPIQQKLMTIILAISGIALLLMGIVFVVYEIVELRQEMVWRVTTTGKIIAANSTAALAFKNQQDAIETLKSLEADSQIVAGALYDAEGNLFATYPSGQGADLYPSKPGQVGYWFEGRYLNSYHQVLQSGSITGTLYLQADMTLSYLRIWKTAGQAAIVLILLLVIAYILSRMLQRQISEPVISLVEATRAVSEQKDYSVRAAIMGKDEIGQVTQAFNYMLSQIQEQNQTLVDSEERFRLLVANVQDYAIIMLDADGHVITWNAGAERIFGYTESEIVGKKITVFFQSGDSHDAPRRCRDGLQDGSVQFQSRSIRKDGSEFLAEVVMTAVCDDTGAVKGISMVTHDVTEREQAEEEIRRLNAELEQKVVERTSQLELAVKELEAFGYSVSHDLRAPLRTIDGFSQAVLEDFSTSVPDEGRYYLQIIRDEAIRMGQLIDDLLTFSRLSREPLTKRTVDTNGLIQSVLAEFEIQKTNRNVRLDVGELPECCADPSLLRQVWHNLISNAFKYTQKRERAVITIGSYDESGLRVYYVRDNGTGFDMKYAHKLFGVFQRLHRSEDYAGTGVGLAIVKRIVNRHGGRVWAESKLDDGATFYFTLEGVNTL